MQVFIPCLSFGESIKYLDRQRLGKQRVEAKQIIDILEGKSKSNSWANHPATLMWKGYTDALKYYHDMCITEWENRGYKNNMPKYNIKLTDGLQLPYWYTDKTLRNKVTQSHRKALLIKDIDYYSKYFKNDIDDIVLEGSKLKGYTKILRNGKEKIITISEHKREYIKNNNVYMWIRR